MTNAWEHCLKADYGKNRNALVVSGNVTGLRRLRDSGGTGSRVYLFGSFLLISRLDRFCWIFRQKGRIFSAGARCRPVPEGVFSRKNRNFPAGEVLL